MSWDVLIMRFPEGFDGDFDETPDDWEPEILFTQDYFEEKIKKICEKFKCQALDTTESKLIDFNEETNTGFTQWREYRNKVLKNKS